MLLDTDVKQIAAHWGLRPELLQAVIIAEGNIVRAVQCSVPTVTDRAGALDVLCRSAVHAMSDFLQQPVSVPDGQSPWVEFIHFWGARWAPVGAGNDPTHLNKNWVGNVLSAWTVLTAPPPPPPPAHAS